MLENEKYERLSWAADNLASVKLAVSGSELAEKGVPIGPGMGKILNRLLRFACEKPEKNEKEYLLSMVEGELNENLSLRSIKQHD